MKKPVLKIVVILESILLAVAVIFLSAFCYDALKFNPNRYYREKFYSAADMTDMLTKYGLPMFDSVDLDFIESTALFQNNYSVLAQVRKHAEQGDGYVYADYGGVLLNGKCPENGLDWYLRQGAALQQWFADVNETAEAATWETLQEESTNKNFYAFFKVNGSYRLDNENGEFYQALGAGSAELPELEWAGRVLPGTDFLFGTPLGRRVRPAESGTKRNVWLFANNVLQNRNDRLLDWFFDTGLFGDFSNADFSAYLSEPFTMDAVMIVGNKDVILKYKGNSVLTLAYYSKSKV